MVMTLLFFALIVRYYHTKIGLPYLYYWDEPQTASTALHIMKSGDLNPHFFAYGSMMIYANLLVDILHYFSLMGHSHTAESFLTNINDIQINTDTGWRWTISHPSFYHWNRVLSALMGVGTVFVTFLIGRLAFNRWIGLIAAAFLAILPFHVIRSAWVSTDSPVTFFVLLVVLFSLLFIKSHKLSYFILSLVFAGVAIATKYNSGLAVLIPFISLLWLYFKSKESVKSYMWFLVPTIPIAVFLMIMPYAIIDLPTFLRHVGGEIRHYKVLGQGYGHTSSPGLEHLKFQLLQFYSNIGFFNGVMIGLGIAGILFRPLFIFTLMMPLLYISYMIGTKVNYHRNFVQVYPFLALLFASGFYVLYSIIEKVRIRLEWQKAWIAPLAVAIVVLLFLVPQASSTYALAKMEKKARDSRTHTIADINTLQGFKKLVIAKELRIHWQDLRKLKLPYSIKPLLDIASQKTNEDTLYVLPALIASSEKKDEEKITAMRNFVASIEAFIIKKVSKNDRGDERNYVGITRLHLYSINPDILLVKNWRTVVEK